MALLRDLSCRFVLARMARVQMPVVPRDSTHWYTRSSSRERVVSLWLVGGVSYGGSVELEGSWGLGWAAYLVAMSCGRAFQHTSPSHWSSWKSWLDTSS